MKLGIIKPQSGFSMIEVLIALVVLAVGLLGVALLQTVSLRYSQSANYRTKAVNLAYDWLDQVRANRAQRTKYTNVTRADFASVDSKTCNPGGTGFLPPAENLNRWMCKVRISLGDDAYAVVEQNATAPNVIVVKMNWADDNGIVGAKNGSVTVETRL